MGGVKREWDCRLETRLGIVLMRVSLELVRGKLHVSKMLLLIYALKLKRLQTV